MREYGRVATRFWNDRIIKPLGKDSKLLAQYLMTGPESNLSGCFVCSPYHVAASGVLDPDEALDAIMDLVKIGFIKYDFETNVCFLVNFFKHNPIQNQNCGKAAVRILAQLPESPVVDAAVVAIDQFTSYLPKGWLSTLNGSSSTYKGLDKGLGKQSPKGFGYSGSGTGTETGGGMRARAREAVGGQLSTTEARVEEESPPVDFIKDQDRKEGSPPATPKQIKFADRLLRENESTLQAWASEHGVARLLDCHITEIRAECAGQQRACRDGPEEGPRPYDVADDGDEPDLTPTERDEAALALADAKAKAGLI